MSPFTLALDERSKLTPRMLEVLAALEQAGGNQLRAGEGLGVTAGTACRTVNNIEVRLGRRLYERSPGAPRKTGVRAERDDVPDDCCGRCWEPLGEDIEHVCARAA